MIKRLLVLTALCVSLGASRAFAQQAPVPMQGCSALCGSLIPSGTTLYSLSMVYHSTGNRWVMLFDASSVPGNGTVAPLWCQPVITSTATDGGQTWSFNNPIVFRTGIVAVVSTSATGCGSLTADGSNDWLFAQAGNH